MFWKKNKKTHPYFVFNLGSKQPEKCLAFSVEQGKASAEWHNEDGTACRYEGVAVDDGFWAELVRVAESHGMFDWKAYKLCNRFVSEICPDVFDGEGLLPDGRVFAANNMHGFPDGFEQAAAELTALFAGLNQ